MATLPGRLLLYISLFLFISLILPSFFLTLSCCSFPLSHVLSSSLFQHLMGVKREKIDLENCRFAFFFENSDRVKTSTEKEQSFFRKEFNKKKLFKGRMTFLFIILCYTTSCYIGLLISLILLFKAEKIKLSFFKVFFFSE
jgi:hypothetical protein